MKKSEWLGFVVGVLIPVPILVFAVYLSYIAFRVCHPDAPLWYWFFGGR